MRPTDRRSAALISLILTTVSCAITPAADDVRAAADSMAVDSHETLNAEAEAVARVLGDRNTGLLPAEVVHLSRVIVQESHRAELPSSFVLAVIDVESRGSNFAVSSVGALGLMQIMPATGEFVARRFDVAWRGRETLFDPAVNVRLGIRYLKDLIDRYADVRTALAAYNAGPAKVSRRMRTGEPISHTYADKVLAIYAEAGEEI
jgi:soluble lytic murein transglycosylase